MADAPTRRLARSLLAFLAVLSMAADRGPSRRLDLGELSIELPAGWSRVKGRANALLTALAPSDGETDTFRENLRVETAALRPGERTIDDVLAADLEHESGRSKLKRIARGELAASDGTRILWMALTPKSLPADEERLTMIDYGCVHGRNAYLFHFMVEPSKYQDYLPKFEGIMRSVRFAAVPGAARKVPAPTSQDPGQIEQAKGLGQVVFMLMILVVIGYGIMKMIQGLRDARRSRGENEPQADSEAEAAKPAYRAAYVRVAAGWALILLVSLPLLLRDRANPPPHLLAYKIGGGCITLGCLLLLARATRNWRHVLLWLLLLLFGAALVTYPQTLPEVIRSLVP